MPNIIINQEDSQIQLPYFKSFTFILSQVETNPPTHITLSDTLGGEWEWVRNNEGNYSLFDNSLIPVLKENKTAVFLTATNDILFTTSVNVGGSEIQFYSGELSNGTRHDNYLVDAFVEVRVY